MMRDVWSCCHTKRNLKGYDSSVCNREAEEDMTEIYKSMKGVSKMNEELLFTK